MNAEKGFEQKIIPLSIYDQKTPNVEHGSFLIQRLGQLSGYEALSSPKKDMDDPMIRFSPNSAYERYLKMHKVFLGTKGSEELISIHDRLKGETMPRYLTAAGWAATEAALIRDTDSTSSRLHLLQSSAQCWERALATQQKLNERGVVHSNEPALPFRSALDMAVLPLFEDMVFGNVREETVKRVFTDCLQIAQANIVQLQLAKKAGEINAVGEHIGFGYECNAMLALNRIQSPTWFAIPSMMRSDTGYHHRKQTHDLIVIHQKRGQILSMTPVEVKAAASRSERDRYNALLVRGKMHLSIDGMHRPEDTLESITAIEEGRGKLLDMKITGAITKRFTSMIRDYYAGEKLDEKTNRRGTMSFRDKSLVAEHHPGLKVA